ncbi:MAG: thiaminase II [Thermoleophilia bacterium]|nr:thiaminase II [Thermoleophilia bacterium]
MTSTTGLSLSQELWEETADIYAGVLRHPFMTGLTDGTLPEESFRFYIVQDTLYLREYARVHSVAAGKAGSPHDMQHFNRIAAELVHAEQTVHADFFREWGLSDEDVWATPMAPTNVAYTTYMLSAAYGGTFAEAVGAVLPCAWIYLEVGKELVRAGSPHPLYQRWIDMYGSEEYAEIVRVVIDMADRLGPGLSPQERALVTERFVVGARYEWMFWDMGYRREAWPV